ncbi:hypothetical protein NKG94_24625 [Micromonospora sp. M12]
MGHTFPELCPLGATAGARADADVWVGQFFTDLTDEVRRQARPVAGMRIGFFDQHIPLGADWKAALAEALGDAEVFVPLYSPGYFSRPWALGSRSPSGPVGRRRAGPAHRRPPHPGAVDPVPRGRPIRSWTAPWTWAATSRRTPPTACARSACWLPTGSSTSFC